MENTYTCGLVFWIRRKLFYCSLPFCLRQRLEEIEKIKNIKMCSKKFLLLKNDIYRSACRAILQCKEILKKSNKNISLKQQMKFCKVSYSRIFSNWATTLHTDHNGNPIYNQPDPKPLSPWFEITHACLLCVLKYLEPVSRTFSNC